MFLLNLLGLRTKFIGSICIGAGLLLICAAAFIYVMPQLLPYIIAAVLLLLGIGLVYLGNMIRKT